MQLEKSPCPYCKGASFIHVGYVEKVQSGRRTLYPYAQPCYCELNNAIGKQFGMLSPLPDATPKDIDKISSDYGRNNKSRGNFVFYGDEQSFLYVVKCFFLKMCTHKDYILIEGSSIVDKYNRPDSDGNRLTVSALDQYDLLVILFTSRSEPPSLKGCVADVLKNRMRVDKPTWIYAQDRDHLTGSKEYSSDVETFLTVCTVVDLSTDLQLTGYNGVESDKVKSQKSRAVQDNLGSI